MKMNRLKTKEEYRTLINLIFNHLIMIEEEKNINLIKKEKKN